MILTTALPAYTAGVVLLSVLAYVLTRIKAAYISYAFTIAVAGCLAVGNAMSELPTARMFAADTAGRVAFTLIILGISGAMILFGRHAEHAGPLQRRMRDFIFVIYSVTASTIGIYAINLDADLSNARRQQLISSLQSDIHNLRYGSNGISPADNSTPCALTRWCNSAAKQAQIDEKTAQVSELMSAETVTPFKALAPLAALLRLPVEWIAFAFNAVRSLVCMYGLLIASKVAGSQLADIQGRADTDRPRQTKRRQQQTRRRRPLRRLFKRNRQTQTIDIDAQVRRLSKRYSATDKATMRKIRSALGGKGIDNNVASAIAKKINAKYVDATT